MAKRNSKTCQGRCEGAATLRAARQGKARQGEAIKAQDLKYFPSGGPFRGAAGHAYKPVDSPRSHIRVELPPISPLLSIAALPSQRHPHPVPVPVCLLRRKSAHNVDTHRNRHAARCVATRCVCTCVLVCVCATWHALNAEQKHKLKDMSAPCLLCCAVPCRAVAPPAAAASVPQCHYV